MDISNYRQEVANIESQVAALNGKSSNYRTSNVGDIGSPAISKSKFMIYLPYAIIFIISGFLVWLIKPKIVLKIIVDKGDIPTMVINKSRFFLVWVILLVLLSVAFYFMRARYNV